MILIFFYFLFKRIFHYNRSGTNWPGKLRTKPRTTSTMVKIDLNEAEPDPNLNLEYAPEEQPMEIATTMATTLQT